MVYGGRKIAQSFVSLDSLAAVITSVMYTDEPKQSRHYEKCLDKFMRKKYLCYKKSKLRSHLLNTSFFLGSLNIHPFFQ